MIVGADVSKDELVVHELGGGTSSIQNNRREIEGLLLTLSPKATIAMEATGNYHRLLADAAFSRGFRVIVFNPKDVLHYARSTSPRAKTDRVDARVIAQCVASSEAADKELHPYQPVPDAIAKLRSLLQTRASLVHTKVALTNRLKQCPESASYLEDSVDGLMQPMKGLNEEILRLARSLPGYEHLRGAPGFGPVVAPYLTALLAGKNFLTSDSFVAFIGLDVRVRESGKRKGRSSLSKRGDPEARRLLYLAAKAASRNSGPFRDLYLRHQAKGLSKIAALVAVARKLARTAWSIYTKGEPYNADRVLTQRRGGNKPATNALSTHSHPQATAPVAGTSKQQERTTRLDNTT